MKIKKSNKNLYQPIFSYVFLKANKMVDSLNRISKPVKFAKIIRIQKIRLKSKSIVTRNKRIVMRTLEYMMSPRPLKQRNINSMCWARTKWILLSVRWGMMCFTRQSSEILESSSIKTSINQLFTFFKKDIRQIIILSNASIIISARDCLNSFKIHYNNKMKIYLLKTLTT